MFLQDVYSFLKEHKFDKGFGNILTVIMKNKETSYLDLQGALDYAAKMSEAALERFHVCKRNLPSVNPEIDAYLAAYAEAIPDTAAGNVYWHSISPRYNVFENEEARKNNIVRWEL